jgi:hypothetical protein
MTHNDSDHTARRLQIMGCMRRALLRNDIAALREATHELRALDDSIGLAFGRRGARLGLGHDAPPGSVPPARPPANEAS